MHSRSCAARRSGEAVDSWAARRNGGAVDWCPGRGWAALGYVAMRVPLANPSQGQEPGLAPKWYVIQVIAGREERMAALISKATSADVLKECFCPMFATETKVRGEWVPVKRVMLPGYIIAVTDNPRGVADSLVRLPEFCRVLKQGGVFEPLAKDEVQIIGGATKPGDRTVPMSCAFKDGDEVIITSGPLKGHEALIESVDRRKSVAYLAFDICGRHVTSRVGIAVVSAMGERARRRA